MDLECIVRVHRAHELGTRAVPRPQDNGHVDYLGEYLKSWVLGPVGEAYPSQKISGSSDQG